jgi:hypothetical protein
MVPTNNTDDSGTPGRVRAGGRDVRCPISQEGIELKQCFKFVTASGHAIAFSADALAAYLRSSGRFKCPCTQEKFNAVVVSRIEQRAVAAGAPAHGLRGAYEMRSAIAYREIEHANRLLAYENSCGADLNEALDICADLDLTRERANRYLLRDVLPNWRQTCSDYMRLSREACRVMLQSDAERLRRLSSVEDADVHGLLHIVIDAVDERLRACDGYLRLLDTSSREDALREWLREDLIALGNQQLPPLFVTASNVGAFGAHTAAFGSLFSLGSVGDVVTPASVAAPVRLPLTVARPALTGSGLSGLTFAAASLDQFAGILGLRPSVQDLARRPQNSSAAPDGSAGRTT